MAFFALLGVLLPLNRAGPRRTNPTKFILNLANFFLNSKDEAFEKCLILFKFKAGENFNRRHTLSILRIEI
jgi:hypothetical protein